MNTLSCARTLDMFSSPPPEPDSSELQQPPQDVLSIWASYPPAPPDNAIMARLGGFIDVCRVVTDGGMINGQSVQDWLVLPLHDAQHNMTGLAYLPPKPNGQPIYYSDKQGDQGHHPQGGVLLNMQHIAHGQPVYVVSDPTAGFMLARALLPVVVSLTPEQWRGMRPKHAANLRYQVQAWCKAGHAVIVPVEHSLLKKYQDWLSDTSATVIGIEGMNAPSLLEPLELAETIKAAMPADTGDGIPDGHLIEPMQYGGGRFEVLPDGLFFVDKDKDGGEHETFVSSPIIVRAMTRSGTSQAWGRLLEWRDPDNRLHQWAMPVELLQGDGTDVRRELASRGVQIHPNKRTRDLFTLYLQSYPTTARALCVERLGWCGGVYVMPDRASGQSDQLTVFQNPHGLEPAFSQLGTLQQWRDHVAALATGNSRLGLAVSMAFAAVLADLVGEQGGGIHIRGGSSTGKSTALKMACSVWGDPEQYGREWRTTDNALEGLAALHNDGLLVLDELNQCDPRTAGTAVYMLANGQGKARMHKTGSSRPVTKWRVLFLSAGEESLGAIMQQAGKRTNAGQEIRLAEIPADAGQGMGMFEHIHTASSPQAFSDQIKDVSSCYYGTAGQAFLDHVTHDRLQATERAKRYMQAFAQHIPSHATGQAHRVGRRFALIAAGGEIATDAGITGWTAGQATESARQCFNAWLESFGMIGNHEERAILAHVKGFFEAHGSSRFEAFYQPDPDKHERINNRAGYWRAEGDSRRYLVFPEQFKNEICKGYDHRQVSKVLIEHGWIDHNNDSGATKPERLPDTGKLTRMYSFNDRMWCESVTDTEKYARNSRNNRNNQQQQGQNLLREAKTQTVTTVTNTVTSQPAGQTPPSVTVVTEGQNSNRNSVNPSISKPVTVVTPVTAAKQPKPPVTAVTRPQQQGLIEL